jgi:hypothetical protein
MAPITDVREISRIGYGFMASRALFAALDADVFGCLAGGPKTLDAIAADLGLAAGRLGALLTACVGLGLLTREGERYANAPASATYLVRTSPAYFGDYFRFQVSRQIYPTLMHLDAALRGERVDFYSQLRDPEEARAFTIAQHSGSLGPAHVVAKLVDLAGARRLLDVAGGSGAFSIVLCERTAGLTSTIIDFPSVAAVGRGLGARARTGRSHHVRRGRRARRGVADGQRRGADVVSALGGERGGDRRVARPRLQGPASGGSAARSRLHGGRRSLGSAAGRPLATQRDHHRRGRGDAHPGVAQAHGAQCRVRRVRGDAGGAGHHAPSVRTAVTRW